MRKFFVLLILVVICNFAYGQDMETEQQSLAAEAREIVAEADRILLSDGVYPVEQVERLVARIDSFSRRYYLWVAVYNPSWSQNRIEQLHLALLQTSGL
jgi:hypothetical protein